MAWGKYRKNADIIIRKTNNGIRLSGPHKYAVKAPTKSMSISLLRRRITQLEGYIANDNLDRTGFRYILFGLQNRLSDYQKALALAEEKLQKEAEKKQKFESSIKAKVRKTVVAAEQKHTQARVIQKHYEGKSRELADQLKPVLRKEAEERQNVCPYCSQHLGLQPHLDHIHPVSKGGMSSIENLVYVCTNCNLRKSNKSLFSFATEYGLNFPALANRLQKMGKFV